MAKRSQIATRTRADTYVDKNQRICCQTCETDLLYHETTWWAVYDAVRDGAVYIDNRDHDDGEFTCECKGVRWDLELRE